MSSVPSAAQTVGPFFREGLDRPAWSDLTSVHTTGERIRIIGRLLDGDGAPVPDGVIEIWQADANGEYNTPGFRGFGRACTDAAGTFAFTTVKPGALAGPSGATQAPHINITIFARGLTRALNTRLYFADATAENARDPLLCALGDDERRTLLAQFEHEGTGPAYRLDIVLQGERETVFLEF